MNAQKLDVNQSAYFHATVANRWLAVRLECIASGIVTGAVLFVVIGGDSVLPSLAGLSISYALAVRRWGRLVCV